MRHPHDRSGAASSSKRATSEKSEVSARVTGIHVHRIIHQCQRRCQVHNQKNRYKKMAPKTSLAKPAEAKQSVLAPKVEEPKEIKESVPRVIITPKADLEEPEVFAIPGVCRIKYG